MPLPCDNKKRYLSEVEAYQTAAKRVVAGSGVLRAYRCPLCYQTEFKDKNRWVVAFIAEIGNRWRWQARKGESRVKSMEGFDTPWAAANDLRRLARAGKLVWS